MEDKISWLGGWASQWCPLHTEESALHGEDDGRNKRKLLLLHAKPIRIFHLSLKESGGPKHLLL
jgi:hypothetical protein